MTQALPRLGLDNLLWKNRRHLVASSVASGHDVENIADWTAGRYWRPALAANPNPAAYVYCYPLNETNRINVRNWFLKNWSDGASAAPDGWTLVGAGASVARGTTDVVIHDYSATVTRAGTNCYLEQAVSPWSQHVLKRVTAGVKCKTSTGSHVRITVQDGSGSTSSSYHTGGGAFEYLTVTHEIAHDATDLTIRLEVNGTDAAAVFDSVVLYVGTSATEPPHAQSVDYLAVFDHNCGSGDIDVILQYTADPTPGPGSSWSNHLTLSPATDRAAWVDTQTPQSASAWRLRVVGGTGSAQPYLGVVAFGSYLSLPDYIGDGFNPYDRTLQVDTLQTRSGTPIQRQVRRGALPLTLRFLDASEAQITGAYQTLLEHAGDRSPGRALPFFFQWDDGDHASQTFYCYLDDGAAFRAGLSRGYAAPEVSIGGFMAVTEA